MEFSTLLISCFLGYLLVGAVVSGLARRFKLISNSDVEMAIIFWPIQLVLAIFMFIATLVAGD